jgi:hypothetical protein
LHFDNFKNDIILQWVLGLVGKYKNNLANLYLHIWLIAKTWQNFLMADLEEDYKIEKMKRSKKSLIYHYYYHL